MQEESNCFIGIDVSKDTLDIYYSSKHFKIKNDARSISNFIKLEITSSIQIKLCVLESTGGYEKLVMKILQQAGVPVHRAHPNRVYSFAKTIKHFAKTDKLDSMLLAKYARFVADEQSGDTIVTAVCEQLQSLKAIEFDLETHMQANKNRLHHLDKKSASYVKKQIAFAQKQLQSIRADIDLLIDDDDVLKQKRNILESYKGIGKKTSSVLLVALPELGTITVIHQSYWSS
jgi:transposase